MDDKLRGLALTPAVRAKLKNKELLLEQLRAGDSAQQILEISDATMEELYKTAYQLSEHKRYAAAAKAFLFLVTLNPYEFNYWLSLGIASQMCGEYEAAIDAYEIAAIYQLENPMPYFYMAKCLFSIHDRESALEAFNLAIEYADNNVEHAEIKRQASVARETLLKHG